MKLILTIFIFIAPILGYTQSISISFDPPGYNLNYIYIDSVSTPGCLWRIGSPNKVVFDTSYSAPNAIVTDLLNPVSPNDTSIFYIRIPWDHTQAIHNFEVSFAFQIDGDTSDFGMVEVSPDNGQTWIDMLTSDTSYFFHNDGIQNIIGSKNGWYGFDVNAYEWASGITSHAQVTADTVLLKFTYVTGNHSAMYDGWIIDNIYINDFPWPPVGLGETLENSRNQIFPNPASNYLYFKNSGSKIKHISLINSFGQIIYNENSQNIVNLYVGNYPDGLYYLYFETNNNNNFKQKLIIKH